MIRNVEEILFMILASRKKSGLRYFNGEEKKRYTSFWMEFQRLYKNKPFIDIGIIKSLPNNIPAPFKYVSQVFYSFIFFAPISLSIIFYKAQFDLFFSTLLSMMSILVVVALNLFYRMRIGVRQSRLIDTLELIRDNLKKKK